MHMKFPTVSVSVRLYMGFDRPYIHGLNHVYGPAIAGGAETWVRFPATAILLLF